MHRGYVKIYRCIQDNPMWHDKPFSRAIAWIDLLILANYKQGTVRKRGIKIIVERGQVGWSERELAERWGWSRGKVHRFIEELENEQQIVQQNGPQNINVTSLITILNYDKYQTDEPQNEPETGHRQAANSTMNKKVKKEKNIDSDILKKPKQPAHKKTDDEWLIELKENPAYRGMNFDVEIGKANAWCMTHNRKCSRAFLLNWFNRAEKTVDIKPGQDKAHYYSEAHRKTFERAQA